jgi:hypothetical protein
MIKSYIDSISKNRIISETSGFDFNYNNKNYIISVHHGLPIINSLLDDIELEILHNPIWNELIIFNNSKIIKKTNYKNKLPKIGDILYINDIVITVCDYIFINLNGLPTNPRNIYIKAHSNDEIFKSMSGLPIINSNNDIVGILCKTDNDNNVYILPIYYLIKVLEKKNNNSIYDINTDDINQDEIIKINTNIVKNNKIYHLKLKNYIYTDTYYLLEGDSEKSIKINDNNVEFQDITNDLTISNNRYLEIFNEQFLLNSCLIKIIHEEFPCIFREFFNFIKENSENKILVKYTNEIEEHLNSIILNIDEYYIICRVYE